MSRMTRVTHGVPTPQGRGRSRSHPWSASMCPSDPRRAVLLALRGRLCNMVINRMHKSGDGDIVLPQRALSVVGTSSWVVEDPDDLASRRITSSGCTPRGRS